MSSLCPSEWLRRHRPRVYPTAHEWVEAEREQMRLLNEWLARTPAEREERRQLARRRQGETARAAA